MAMALAVAGAAAADAPRWLAPQTLAPAGGIAPFVTVDAHGNALAAWSGVGAAAQITVAARPAGGTAWSAPVTISPPGYVQMGQVRFDAAGGAAAVWTANVAGNLDAAVVQAAVRPAGADAFGPVQELSAAPTFAIAPRLAADGTGAMVAVWEQRATGRTGAGVVMAATRPAGAASFGPPEVLSDPGADARQPDVAMDAAGDALVVWTGGTSGQFAVQARLRVAGTSAWQPAVGLSGADAAAGTARVAMDPAGNAVAAWTASDAGVASLHAAARAAGGAWGAAEDLGPATLPEAPALVAEPDDTVTVVYRHPDGIVDRLAARVRPPGGAWSPLQDLSPPGAGVLPAAPLLAAGDRAAAGPSGGVIAVWSRSAERAVVQAAVKPAGAVAFGATADVSAIGRHAEAPSAALLPDGEAVAVWASRPSLIAFGQDVIETADLTTRPGAVLEPPPVQVTALEAPARAGAGTVVLLKATLGSYVDSVQLRPQRLVGGVFVDAGAPATVTGTTATIPVRVTAGENVLRLAYVDRGAPGASPQVTVTGAPNGRPLIAAGTRPVDVEVGLGSVWALSQEPNGEDAVIRIDPRTRRPVGDPIPVGRAADIAVGAGAVWVAGRPGQTPGLRRIDPVAMQVTAALPLETTGTVAVGAGGVWTVECGRNGAISSASCGEQYIVRIDPATNAVASRVQIVAPNSDAYPVASDLTAGTRYVWFRLTSDDGETGAVRFDPASGSSAGVTAPDRSGALQAVGSALWTVAPKCFLARAVGTGAFTRVGRRFAVAQRFSCGAIRVSGRDVWAGEYARAISSSTSAPVQIQRLDARTGAARGAPIRLGAGPIDYAAGEGALWVAYPDAGVVARVPTAVRVAPPPRRSHPPAIVQNRWSGRRTLSAIGADASAPAVAVGGHGRAAAIWLRGLGADHTIESAVRAGARAAWTPARVLDRTHGLPFGAPVQVAAAPTGEAVAAWVARSRTADPYRMRATLLRRTASNWGAPIVVSPPGQDAVLPALGMGPDGGAVAVWSCRCTPPPPGTAAADVQASARPAGGAFTPATALPPASPPLSTLRVAVATGGAAIAAWQAGPPEAGLSVSERGRDGAWSAPTRISAAPDPVMAFVSDAWVAVDPRGDAVAVWQQLTGLMSSRKPAGGAWSAPAPVPAPSGSGVGGLALDGAGNALLVLQAPDQPTLAHRVQALSLAAGSSAWSAPVVLSPAGPTTGRPAPSVGLPVLALNTRGRAIVVWTQTIAGVARVLARRRDTAGGSWGPLEAVSPPARSPMSPSVAIDGAGHAVAVWVERSTPRVTGGRGSAVVRVASSG